MCEHVVAILAETIAKEAAEASSAPCKTVIMIACDTRSKSLWEALNSAGLLYISWSELTNKISV